MNAFDLVVLGRRLTKLGEEAMRGPDAPEIPTGVRLIVTDVLGHPGSPIGEIADRTGLPQSHVSESVARLRERGLVETSDDPGDGRRTLVRLADDVPERLARLGEVPIDPLLAEAMGTTDPDDVADVVAELEALLARLREARGGPGPLAHRLSGTRGAHSGGDSR